MEVAAEPIQSAVRSWMRHVKQPLHGSIVRTRSTLKQPWRGSAVFPERARRGLRERSSKRRASSRPAALGLKPVNASLSIYNLMMILPRWRPDFRYSSAAATSCRPFLTSGDRKDSSTRGERELQREGADAAGTLHQHRLSGLEVTELEQGIPRRQGRSWERRRLLERQNIGNLDKPALIPFGASVGRS
jgi:hypothetical protein